MSGGDGGVGNGEWWIVGCEIYDGRVHDRKITLHKSKGTHMQVGIRSQESHKNIKKKKCMMTIILMQNRLFPRWGVKRGVTRHDSTETKDDDDDDDG